MTVDYQALFTGLPTAYLVTTPDLIILDASDAYLALVGRRREDLVGIAVFEAFPPTPEALDEAGRNPLRVAFERVRDTAAPTVMPVHKYDVLDPESGQIVERFWSLVILPVTGPDGSTELLVQQAQDVTDHVREQEGRRLEVRRGDAWRRRVQTAEADLSTRARELEWAEQARGVAFRRLASLAEVALQLSNADTLQDLTEVIVGAGLAALGADGGAIAVREGDGDRLRLTMTDSLGPSARRRYAEMPFDGPLPLAVAARTGEPVILGSRAAGLALTGEMGPVYETTGKLAWAALPLRTRERVLGSLILGWTEERDFSPDDLRLLDAFAVQCAQAMERIHAMQALAEQALTDPLTGLPNRRLFLDQLRGALALAQRHDRDVAVLFLDLDRFKVINDSMGHKVGDRLLIEVAARLEAALRPSDTAARFGGDEFAVLCQDLHAESAAIGAATVAERIVEAVSEVVEVDGREIVVTASIGIAIGTGSEDPDTLLRNADAAMYRAKEKGKARYEWFDRAMQASAVERFETEAALHAALGRGEFALHYQPIIDIITGEIVSVEALLRWQHPDRGAVAPTDFIPLAEETGLIVPIGAWVLGEACRQLAEWRRTVPAMANLAVAVNLSPRQLDFPGIVDAVAQAMGDNDLPADTVCLEITEGLLVADSNASVSTLHALRTFGVSIALDDFGTGYSSLAYLQHFPIDHLKVDQSFVRDINRGQNRKIVAAMVNLAHSLGFPAVAEGVETKYQLDLLRQLGCDRAQGYFIARPTTAAQLTGG